MKNNRLACLFVAIATLVVSCDKEKVHIAPKGYQV